MNKHVLITGGSRYCVVAVGRRLLRHWHLHRPCRGAIALDATADIWMKKERPSAPFSLIRQCCISLPQQQLPDRQHMAPFGQ